MIKIYGSSDDLIEIEGDIREEFYVSGNYFSYLAFSNGFLIRAHFDEDGEWRLINLRGNVDNYELIPPDRGKGEYSDTVIINSKVEWVVLGKDWKSA